MFNAYTNAHTRFLTAIDKRDRDIFILRRELFFNAIKSRTERDRRFSARCLLKFGARYVLGTFYPLLLYPILFFFPTRQTRSLVPAHTNNVMRAAVALPRVTFFRKQTALLSPRPILLSGEEEKELVFLSLKYSLA